jgi:glycosyltransferase involved in cell wall biosynthesis
VSTGTGHPHTDRSVASRRLLVIQYGGDFREAHRRLHRDGTEAYHGHGYVLGALADLGREVGPVGLLCCRTAEQYDEQLEPGLWALGAAADPYDDPGRVMEIATRFDPTDVILHQPIRKLLHWSVRRHERTMAMLAGYFPETSLRRRFDSWRTLRSLEKLPVQLIGNHNRPASEWMAERGVSPERIIPYDWPHEPFPENAAKDLGPASGPRVLFYAGLVLDSKGVGDAIEATALLRDRGQPVLLRVAGTGDVDGMRSLARSRGIDGAIEFLGTLPHHDVEPAMASADAVLIPSRHEYPEGFPLTVYEALRSRSPLVASDHPMLARRLEDGVSAAVFPAGQPQAMADRISRLLSDPVEYRRLSAAARSTWESLQVPTTYADVVSRWYRDTPDSWTWLESRTLAALRAREPGGHLDRTAGSPTTGDLDRGPT